VILDFDAVQGVVRGRSGYGVDAGKVAAAGGPIGDYRVLTELAGVDGPLVVPASEVCRLVPGHCLALFEVHGPIAVQSLRSDRLGLLGIVFCDGGANSTFRARPADLATLAELSEVAALAFQQALLLRRSVSLQELRERSRIAAALHDGVTQQLFVATLEIAELRAGGDLDDAVMAVVDRVADRLGTALQQLRTALVEIASGGVPDDRGPQQSDESVVDRIRRLLGGIGAAGGPTPDLDVTGEGPEPDVAQADLLVRAVREGVANAGHHGKATQVIVHLRRGGSWWTVEIDDDGVGDVAVVRRILRSDRSRSFGLPSLAKECARVGGRIWVSAAPRLHGLRLGVAVPLTTD
jgi:signal transduction histidine kinase